MANFIPFVYGASLGSYKNTPFLKHRVSLERNHLEIIAGLSQARVAHHRSDGPDTGSNSGGRQTTTTK